MSINQSPEKPSYEELEKRLKEALLEIERLKAIIEKLIKKPKINSRNSSQPPSQDPPYKPKSERKPSEKPSGGQVGHLGHSLVWREEVDEIIIHKVEGCCECGREYAQGKLLGVDKRQVFELPILELKVIEHRRESRKCRCGRCKTGEYPKHVTTKVQYGSGVRGLAVYLMNTQFMSLERTAEYFLEVHNAPISQGSLVNWQAEGFSELAGVETQIATGLQQSEVVHADETGIQVGGKNQWWHSVSTSSLTHYSVSQQRGLAGMKVGGILETYTGIVVHDCWGAYFQLPSEHALCHAHLRRELTRVIETTKQTWAVSLKSLLDVMKRRVEAANDGFLVLPNEARNNLANSFSNWVQLGLEENPAVLRGAHTTTTRGAVKQSYQRCLLLRLQKYEPEWLRFLFDARVPSDNNQAERDVRMVKVREKVSGGSRGKGAIWFARVRGYISTLRKQNQGVLQALIQLFEGNTVLPKSLVRANTS